MSQKSYSTTRYSGSNNEDWRNYAGGSGFNSRCSSSLSGFLPDLEISVPPPGSSIADLQAFCNAARNTTSRTQSSCNLDLNGSFHTAQSYFGSQPSPGSKKHGVVHDNECHEDDDGLADLFDEEFFGIENSTNWKFDFPVPMEPVLPMHCLALAQYSADGKTMHSFYTDDEGYVQVYTSGECRDSLAMKAALGVWFGPNHPMNMGEKFHRGRRTYEAAQFAAVIEAIRIAGSCGVTKMQVNTEYVNLVRFMLYFILKWENNGWMTVKGTPVRNQVLIRELDYFSKLVKIKWNFVPIEDEVEGCQEAFRLAQEAYDLEYAGCSSPSLCDDDVPSRPEPRRYSPY